MSPSNEVRGSAAGQSFGCWSHGVMGTHLRPDFACTIVFDANVAWKRRALDMFFAVERRAAAGPRAAMPTTTNWKDDECLSPFQSAWRSSRTWTNFALFSKNRRVGTSEVPTHADRVLEWRTKPATRRPDHS